MMKKSLVIASLLFATTNLTAQDNGWYTGLSIGNIDATGKMSIAGTNLSSVKTDENTKSLTVGKYLNKNDIVSFSKTFVEEDSNVDVEQQNNIKLFAGSSYTKFDYEESGLKAINEKFATDSINWTTNIITLDFGVQFDKIAKNLNAEFGYKLQLTTSGEGTIVYDGTPITMEYDDVSQWYLGINYKF
jgi:hypothetical protein